MSPRENPPRPVTGQCMKCMVEVDPTSSEPHKCGANPYLTMFTLGTVSSGPTGDKSEEAAE